MMMVGDINCNGIVGPDDYTLWADAFGQMGVDLPEDISGNGTVDAADYTLWADNFGMTDGDGPQSVPEASALALAALAMFALPLFTARRRKRN